MAVIRNKHSRPQQDILIETNTVLCRDHAAPADLAAVPDREYRCGVCRPFRDIQPNVRSQIDRISDFDSIGK